MSEDTVQVTATVRREVYDKIIWASSHLMYNATIENVVKNIIDEWASKINPSNE